MTRQHEEFKKKRVESNSPVKSSEVCNAFCKRTAARNNDLLDKQLNETLLFSYFIDCQSRFGFFFKPRQVLQGAFTASACFLDSHVRSLSVHSSVLRQAVDRSNSSRNTFLELT